MRTSVMFWRGDYPPTLIITRGGSEKVVFSHHSAFKSLPHTSTRASKGRPIVTPHMQPATQSKPKRRQSNQLCEKPRSLSKITRARNPQRARLSVCPFWPLRFQSRVGSVEFIFFPAVRKVLSFFFFFASHSDGYVDTRGKIPQVWKL